MTINFDELKKQPVWAAPKANVKTSAVTKPETTNDNSNRNNRNLLYALSGLAVIGLSALYIYKSRSVKSPVANPLKNNLIDDNVLGEFIKKLNKNDRAVFLQNISGFENLKPAFASHLINSKNSISALNKLFVAKQKNITAFPGLPNVLHMSQIDNAARKNVAKVLSTTFNAEYKSTKYTEGYLKEFVGTLKEYSEKIQQPTFIYVDNIEAVVNDLNKAGNEELLSTFKELLNKKDNNVIYVLNKELDNKLFTRKQINFIFNKSVKSHDFHDELKTFSLKEKERLEQIEAALDKGVEKYIDKSTIYNIVGTDYVDNIWLLHNTQGNLLTKLVETVVERTGDKFERVSGLNDIKEIISSLKEQMTKAKEFFDRTEKKTFLHFENLVPIISKSDFASPEYKELKDLLTKTKDSKLTVVVPYENGKNLGRLFVENKYVRQSVFDLEKIREHLVDYQSLGESGNSLKSFIENFSRYLSVEKIGNLTNGGLKNGILLHGNKDKIIKAEEIIKNTLDVNFTELKYDPKQPLESIKNLVIMAKESEENFSKTHRRTIITLQDWDVLLTDEESRQSRKIMARFKQFAESCSENYHTTLFMKTSRPLEDFEDASIASHRFETKIKFGD